MARNDWCLVVVVTSWRSSLGLVDFGVLSHVRDSTCILLQYTRRYSDEDQRAMAKEVVHRSHLLGAGEAGEAGACSSGPTALGMDERFSTRS